MFHVLTVCLEDSRQVKKVKMLVLDEADEMLSKGFKEQVSALVPWYCARKLGLSCLFLLSTFFWPSHRGLWH